MTSKATAKKLASLGFKYDEDVTCRTYYWSGTIDPIGKMSIGGECAGLAVSGNTRAEMDAEAIERAQEMSHMLTPCNDPECDMHWEKLD